MELQSDGEQNISDMKLKSDGKQNMRDMKRG